MLRHTLAVLAAASLVLPFVAVQVFNAPDRPGSTSADAAAPVDGGQELTADDSALAWISTGSGIFSVDAEARTVRYLDCDDDTGRVTDPGMKVSSGVAVGAVTVDGMTYRYRIPLHGRSRGALTLHRALDEDTKITGNVVTIPMPPTSADRADLWEPLAKDLQAVIDDAPKGVGVGVAVRDLSGRYGDSTVRVNGAFRPSAASVIKLWILAELLRQVDCGTAILTSGVLVEREDVVTGTGELRKQEFPQMVPLYRLAEYMIEYSDNTATNVLIDYVGGIEPVNALIDAMNQRQTVLEHKLFDAESEERGEDNYTSADDVLSLLGAVWDGDLLSPTTRQLMLHLMQEQTIDTKIPAALPAGVPIAHKTGELAKASHDVGYYLSPHQETAVVFMTSGSEASGSETVRRLARTVYDFTIGRRTEN